jgi:hypothetical protein
MRRARPDRVGPRSQQIPERASTDHRARQTGKSFLLLFFKKEVLSCKKEPKNICS